MLFPHYTFEHPSTHEVRSIRAKAYVLAGIFLSLYVWRRTDSRHFLRALLLNLFVLAAAAAAVMLAAMLPLAGPLRLVAIAIAWIVLGLMQSRMMVRVIVRYYARQGWEIMRT